MPATAIVRGAAIRPMTRYFIRIAPLAATLAFAACAREPEVDAQLQADLQAASAGSIELAPIGSGTKVVSNVEQVPRVTPRPTAPRPKAPPSESNRVAQSEDPAPTPEPRVVQQAPVNSEPVAVRPTSAPRVQPPPPGGYKTTGEVIRNAPFPIKPLNR
jgi:hypothetical protein